MGIWRRVDKTKYRFLATSGCLLFAKNLYLLAKNWGTYFTDQNEPKGGGRMKINFKYFQIQKWMLQTAVKVDQKIGSSV